MKRGFFLPAVLLAAMGPAVAMAGTPAGAPMGGGSADPGQGLVVHAIVPAPAGTIVEVQGFDGATRQPFACGSATSVPAPDGDSNSSLVTVAVSAACAKSSLPPRLVINGRVLTVFDFRAGAEVDLGRLQILTPEQNSSGPNAGGGGVATLPRTGTPWLPRGGSAWYLLGAVILLGMACITVLGPAVRRLMTGR